MKKPATLVCAVIFILLGCNPTTPVVPATDLPTAVQITPGEPTLVLDELPTHSPTNTATPTPAATTIPKATITPRPTRKPEPVVVVYEITVNEMPAGIQFEGTLVLGGEHSSGCLLDLQTMICADFPPDGFVYLPSYASRMVSPDQTQFAYQDNKQLYMVAADGQQSNLVIWDIEEYWQLTEWIDAQHLILGDTRSKDGLVRELNHETGEWRELAPSFPLVSENGNLAGTALDFWGPLVYYDPLRERVVTLRQREGDYLAAYELWDAESGELLWERASVTGLYSSPEWTKDGEHFSVILGRTPAYRGEVATDLNYGTLYTVSRQGQETAVTDYVVGEVAFSPDESQVATFWRGPQVSHEGGFSILVNPLAIVDLETREISVYTFSIYDAIFAADVTAVPVWSPDGRYLAMTNIDDGDIFEWSSSVVILDTFEKTAFEVAKEYWARGWLADENATQAEILPLSPAQKNTSSETPIITDNFDTPMVFVPEGPFEMGIDADTALAECQNNYFGDCERWWFEDGEPVHTVTLDDFYIDQYEVTNQQFATFLNEQGNQSEGDALWLNAGSWAHVHQNSGTWQPEAGYDNHPAIYVSWYGAQAYCQWRGAYLPTEAQWEKAARGGLENKLYPWGDFFGGSLANYCDTNCDYHWQDGSFDDGYQFTAPVGTYLPNDYNLHDMAGNVWEWTADWFDVYPEGNPNASEYFGEINRVLRGGGWYGHRYYLHVSARTNVEPHLTKDYIGFRCARDTAP